ncbi:MAG: GreA/GreB family elongation factor [Burkholderiales bacterium]
MARTLTEMDHVRIFNLLRRESAAGASSYSAIVNVIDTATLVRPQDVSPDVVTMESRFLVANPNGPDRSELTLCWPADADPAAGKLSILSPVGASMLGLKVGDVARWSTPDGERGAATILEVVFQPEVNGDFVA